MNTKTQFNITEKFKNTNAEEPKKAIIKLVNDLIIKEFANSQNK